MALVERVRTVIEARWFSNFIIAVIIINAVILGLETSKTAMATAGPLLEALDTIALVIFCVEIAAKLFVYRLSFFRSAWNVFDFVIVAIALMPAAEGLSVLRSLRILRALRLISMVPEMRTVVQALLNAIPAMASVIALMTLIFYVAAVMTTKLFGAAFPEWFGTLGASLYSLFQIVTLESWSMGIVRPVMEVHPYAWMFFVPFIVIVTFAVMNLFIAIIVNAMQSASGADEAQHHKENEAHFAELLDELKGLRGEIAQLRKEKASASPAQE
ncbi:MAG: ion transporter [Alphaproteobacteria bacterium]|nr:ion transporter [Alphaproteobacteria bacterium]